MLRGGLEELLRTAPFLKGSLIYFVMSVPLLAPF